MKLILSFLLSAVCFCATAQNKITDTKPDYPRDYFRNPLDIPVFLAGNFGECRPGHFHSGVDIKTLGEENQPVHAAADGYISRIKMESGGFGHGIYITHPNGYTTLYAHLNKFAPAIQKYVTEQQYEQKKWNVDLQLLPGQFAVKKGQQIAWSGNTGASTAPHLHFEIRNTKTEHPLNPQLFGLPVVDHIAPVPAEVVLYMKNVFGQGFYDDRRLIFPLEKNGAAYYLAKTKIVNKEAFLQVYKDTIEYSESLNFAIGINADDYMDGSDNTIAFYTANLYVDDKLQTQITLDDIGYDLSRYINAYSDYTIKKQQNKWVQCLFKLPGNHLDPIYSYLNDKNGWFHCNDTAINRIEIILKDDKNNQSQVIFYLKHSKNDIAIIGDRQGIPAVFKVNQPNTFTDSFVNFTLDSKALYDNIEFNHKTTTYTGGFSDKYQIGYASVPVHNYFELKIKPNKQIPAEMATKVAMMYSDDKDTDGRAASIADNGWYKAKVRNFGTYWLDIDTTAPVIKSMQKNGSNLSKAKQILFEVKDSMTSVRSFGGYLDGKWICFEQHSNKFFYEFDSHCLKGKHELVFKAEDENGNEAVYKLSFVR